MVSLPASDPLIFPLALGTIVAGEFCYIMTNRNYRPNGTVPCFIFCSGKSAGAPNVLGAGFAMELAARGYPVICGDYGDHPTEIMKVDGPGIWGCPAAVTKAKAHVTWMQTTFGAKAGEFGVIYGSHGCALAYALGYAYPTEVQLIAGGIGTADVEDIRANNIAGYQASIEGAAAYGSNANWQVLRPAHNPVQVASTITIPQLDYYSPNDPICLEATHIAIKAAAGVNMDQISLGNVGHTFTGIGPRGGPNDSYRNKDFADWCVAHL